MSQVVTEQSQTVTPDGTVYAGFPGEHSQPIGKTAPPPRGWTTWGLEAAGPPYEPPPMGANDRHGYVARDGSIRIAPATVTSRSTGDKP